MPSIYSNPMHLPPAAPRREQSIPQRAVQAELLQRHNEMREALFAADAQSLNDYGSWLTDDPERLESLLGELLPLLTLSPCGLHSASDILEQIKGLVEKRIGHYAEDTFDAIDCEMELQRRADAYVQEGE